MMSNNSDTIVFMHVPKCAGTMFVSALAQSLQTKEILRGFDRTLFGNFQGFDTIAEGLQKQIYLDQQPSDIGYRIVAGHKGLSSLSAAYRGRPFMTVMREPRIRVISHFLYWRFTPESNFTLWGSYAERMKFARGSLQEFLEKQDIASQIDNLFTRFLLGPHANIPAGDFIPTRLYDSLYKEALAKLVDFDFVDVIENPAIGENVTQWLGRQFLITRANQTTAYPGSSTDIGAELTPRALDRIDSLCAIDRKLWLQIATKRNAGRSADEFSNHLFVQYVAQQAVSLSKHNLVHSKEEMFDAN